MSSLRNQYDEIFNSITNGQRQQAVQQMFNLGMEELPGMLDYFAIDLDRPELAIDAAKSWFRIQSR